MRKIKLLLAAMLCVIGSGIGQAQVKSNEGLSNTKLYTVTTERGAWWVDQANNRMHYNDSYTTSDATPKDDVDYQFAFIKYGDHYYLYAPAVKKFIQPQKYFVDGFSTPVTLAVEGDDVKVKAENSALTINIGGSQWTWDTWTAYDGGNKVTIVEAADFSAEDLETAIANLTGTPHFDPHKVYTIGCERVGQWAVSADHSSLSSTLAYSGATDAEKQFAFWYDEEGKMYIYSVGAGKFLKADGTFVTGKLGDPMDYRIIGTSGYDHMLFIPSSNFYFNSQNSGGYAINSWNSADPGNKQSFTVVADVDAYNDMNNILNPSFLVTYVVKDTEGKTLFTSEALPTSLGTKITTLPTDLQRPYYTYNEVDVTIADLETTIEFTATWTGPFEISAAFATAHWYNMSVRSSYYVTSDNTAADGSLAPILANAIGLVEDAYQWAFVGDGYKGFKLYNKAKGDSKVYAWTANENENIPTFVDVASANTWFIKPSTSSIENSFMLTTDMGYQTNQFGGASGSLKIWKDTRTYDVGSAFKAFNVPTNFAEFVTAEIAPYFDSTAKYFVPNEAAKAAVGYKAEYKTECSYEDYKAMKENLAAVDMTDLNNFVLPETGYYLLKNRNYGTYMGIDPSDANMYGNYAAANLPKHIVKLTKTGDATYTIGLMGKFAPATVAQSKQVTATAEAGTYTVVVPAVGYAAFQADTENNMSVLHCAGGGSIVGWEAPAAASQWEAIDAESIQLEVGEAGYATAYLPFAVAVPEGVEAYTAKITDGAEGTTPGDYKFLTLTDAGATIPAKNAVILKATPKTYVFNIAADVDDLGNNDLMGSLEPVDATGNYVLAKPEGKAVGFYKAESGKIAAGKAHLVGNDANVKAFLFAGDDATGISNLNVNVNDNSPIYNLAGQRISKMQKGINIVNGKKILK